MKNDDDDDPMCQKNQKKFSFFGHPTFLGNLCCPFLLWFVFYFFLTISHNIFL